MRSLRNTSAKERKAEKNREVEDSNRELLTFHHAFFYAIITWPRECGDVGGKQRGTMLSLFSLIHQNNVSSDRVSRTAVYCPASTVTVGKLHK